MPLPSSLGGFWEPSGKSLEAIHLQTTRLVMASVDSSIASNGDHQALNRATFRAAGRLGSECRHARSRSVQEIHEDSLIHFLFRTTRNFRGCSN